MEKCLTIRSSAAEFLTFAVESRADSIEVLYNGETIWATQDVMAALYDIDRSGIAKHLRKIFDEHELDVHSVCAKFARTAADGKTYQTNYYSLDAIIAVGFRVNTNQAVQFRQWANGVLRLYAVRGYVLDRERMENGSFLGEDYFEQLLDEIREIRASERRFYQKITDIYATAMDYHADAPVTKRFFATVQNKLHYAVHGHTAAEVIVDRADAEKEHMGLTTWKNAPNGKILKGDVSIAKNYLTLRESEDLNRIVTMYLDYAEMQARRRIPMTMADWEKRLNAFLQFNEREVLTNPGKVSAEVAKSFAESEYEKYRVVQDRIYQSDFDRFIEKEGLT